MCGGHGFLCSVNLTEWSLHCQPQFRNILSYFKTSSPPSSNGLFHFPFTACKRKDASPEPPQPPKKPRLVFTDLQRRTLQAIFKVRFCSPSLLRVYSHPFFVIIIHILITSWTPFLTSVTWAVRSSRLCT